MPKFEIDSEWLLRRAEEESDKIKAIGLIAKIRALFNPKQAAEREKEMIRSLGRMDFMNEVFEHVKKNNP